jgi:hypothetical protein
VGLLALIVRQLTGSARLACFGAVLWGVNPLVEGTIGWYSVWGHALATATLLIVLTRLLDAGARGGVRNAELAVWVLLVVAGSTFFGTGLAWALVLPVMALLLLASGPVRRRVVGALAVGAVIVVLFYLGAQRLARELYGSTAGPPRLLPLLRGSPAIADLVTGMIAFGLGELALGPFARAVNGLAPIVGAAPIVAGAAVALVRGARKTSRSMAAFALFAVVTYAVIAAGRLAFYSRMREGLIHAERYHYAAPLAFAVLICLGLAEVGGRLRLRSRTADGLLVLWLAGVALVLAVGRRPIDHHDQARALAGQALASLRGLVAAAPPGDVYVTNQPFFGVGPLVIASPSYFPRLAGLFLVFHPDGRLDGRRVLFVEADERVRVGASRGIRSSGLLVAPDDVPPGRPVLEPAMSLPVPSG